jgi:hypothetical protein
MHWLTQMVLSDWPVQIAIVVSSFYALAFFTLLIFFSRRIAAEVALALTIIAIFAAVLWIRDFVADM